VWGARWAAEPDRRRPEAQITAGFMGACEDGRSGAVEFPLDRGVDVAAIGPPHGQTGIHSAARGGHVDIVKLLS
jgi:ankyrin repeat protein